ncbi:hypothetical protein J7T55_000116 [Diaporthe amygdali]|uniref:uncharacterized protein n=1 Tax=Phomopsis amygdali TaxID=1214568 RepID=UPI0022FDBBFF|nr:uncharacterized protein J7T55_000116 [Diaporthe amygdali]KAJ0100757.1 hypothetical protein J7T55_000116 [Diaporthe amygdali]
MSTCVSFIKKSSSKIMTCFGNPERRTGCRKGPTENEDVLAITKPVMATSPVTVDEKSEDHVRSNVPASPLDEQRKAKREARRVKWASMCTQFKQRTNKMAKALAKPLIIIVAVIFGPVLLVIDLGVFLILFVGRLVFSILDLLFASIYACFVWYDGC